MSTVRWRVMVAAALVWLAGCAHPAPEQRLRDTVAALQSAIVARDVAGMKDVLADDFVGSDGLDRDGAVRLAQVMFLQHHDVGARLGPLHVGMKGTHATVRFTAALTGGPGTTLPDAARVYDVETGWRLEGEEWQLTSANWTPDF